MGLGLWLLGDVDKNASHDLFSRAAEWFEGHAADDLLHLEMASDEEGNPTLAVGLHRSAEDLELTLLDKRFVRASCKTSTTGPGYHAYVCELLHSLAAPLGIAWHPPTEEHADETGYFHSRDADALEREFLAWVGGLARMLVESHAKGKHGFAVSMSPSVRFAEDAFMSTPMGPRDANWAHEVARDSQRGIDIFPWWGLGKDAAYARGRAVIHMWQDVPWRPPVDEAEAALLRRVDALLVRAHAADPRLALPWSEWAELLEHLGEHRADVRARASSAPPPRIGYRRGDVTNTLTGQWSVRAPGAFVGHFDDEGTWSAFDGVRTLWFSSFSMNGSDGKPAPPKEVLPTSPAKGRPVDLPQRRRTPYRAHLSTRNDGDGEYLCLQTEVAAPGSLGVLTIAFSDESDVPLAARIAGSLAHGS